jgi:hypothetical protein
MSRWGRRQDSNHAQVLEALARAGLDVLDTSRCAGLGCDAIVWRGDRFRLIEVKDAAKRPSARRLTDAEARLRLRYPRVYRVVTDEATARAVAEELR